MKKYTSAQLAFENKDYKALIQILRDLLATFTDNDYRKECLTLGDKAHNTIKHEISTLRNEIDTIYNKSKMLRALGESLLTRKKTMDTRDNIQRINDRLAVLYEWDEELIKLCKEKNM